MWKSILPLSLLFLLGCNQPSKERTLHGKIREISQRIEHHGDATISLLFYENGTSIVVFSDEGIPIGGEDFVNKEVVLTYKVGEWENKFIRLEKIEDYTKRIYEQSKAKQ